MIDFVNKAPNIDSGGVSDDKWVSYRPTDLTPLEAVIYNRLEQGSRWDPVTRRDLVFLTKKNDRAVRDMIASIRQKGGWVCGLSGWYGYWIAKNADDLKALRKEYISRINSLSKVLRAMDSVVGGQLSWDDM